ncbi:putative lipoprotein [Rahnella aquatilis CIP 78.65 = ATCC 33071]|uniref:Putative dienelactone hydrolase n=1 Tax=Rahnella aquatilis (strain ATCC 33071 / DSM 4594 / JCM 1683 / NBRC 105701 / NCIMB 13365 / CIP 78.65) TaxID=745277 RepID=H2IW84_RAHAC|nr:alpha/beta fold hydrolase [Rahnella aquatilis]AEX51816.1 putative dienelactone hydrolase [Rahnella aquatilis CIP 78.65 = ATCC 33071]KFD15616.1 putative lipoprotein [Rahnella aquatilis CIP 78.65 = ATCC 33071]
MMCIRAFCLLSVFLYCIQVQASPGFRQITLSDSKFETLHVTVWYPASTEGRTVDIGSNPAFVGVTVNPDAPPLPGVHPLLVISHGYNGNWRNLSWIAAAMAAEGYIVAAPDHPGTTTFDQNPTEAKKLWRRPHDISRVIDFVIDSPALFGATDKGRIAALGHSLGGWTVMSLAGARFKPSLFIDDCHNHPKRGDCRLTEKLGINETLSQEKISANNRDARIRAVVSLDLGLAPGFTPQSLNAINIPVLILAAQADRLADLPAGQESGYLAAKMNPNRRQYEIIEGATHFSFMQLCKPGAENILNEESPGDDIVCQDGLHAKRSNIHQNLVSKISAFLNSALDYTASSVGTKSVTGLKLAEIHD